MPNQTLTLSSPHPNQVYYVSARAVLWVNGNAYASGQGSVLSRVLAPNLPLGDGAGPTAITYQTLAQSTGNPNALGLDVATIPYTLPTNSGSWDRILVFKGTSPSAGGSQLQAQQLAITASTNNTNSTGPTGTPVQIIMRNTLVGTPTTINITDSKLGADQVSCYVIQAAFAPGQPNTFPSVSQPTTPYYSSSQNAQTLCVKPNYVSPNTYGWTGINSSGGVNAAVVNGTCADGTAKIQLTLAVNLQPGWSIDQFAIYYSPTQTPIGNFNLSGTPWQSINFNDSTHVPSQSGNVINVGCNGQTFSGSGYFVVRWVYYAASGTDTNTSINANPVSVPGAQANFTLVPKAVSRLSYDYYMMNYEASFAGWNDAGRRCGSVEYYQYLSSCNSTFHNEANAPLPLSSNCGTIVSTGIARSVKNVAPSPATWDQAWVACRNASSSALRVRLPTEEEFRRAARWASDDYNGMVSAYTNTGGSNCNLGSNVVSTGSRSSCKNFLGLYDMAGNMREWVDRRMGPVTFSSTNTGGIAISNALDGLLPHFTLVAPGVNGVELLLGSGAGTKNYLTPPGSGPVTYDQGTNTLLGDAEAELWDNIPSTNTPPANYGFRCVAFPSGYSKSNMLYYELPQEPAYQTSDAQGSPANWNLPPTKYVGDTIPESLTITGSAATPGSPATAATLRWRPWSKELRKYVPASFCLLYLSFSGTESIGYSAEHYLGSRQWNFGLFPCGGWRSSFEPLGGHLGTGGDMDSDCYHSRESELRFLANRVLYFNLVYLFGHDAL